MAETDRLSKLKMFLELIVTEDTRSQIDRILEQAGARDEVLLKTQTFTKYAFHSEIQQHCKDLFIDGYYFHAVFEAVKIYHKLVQNKACISKDGQALMLEAWNPDKGTLKLTACKTETDRNVQEGMAFLSAGMIRAIRNPTAHEPAYDWPISEKDCLDVLSFISFLIRKLDESVFYSGIR